MNSYFQMNKMGTKSDYHINTVYCYQASTVLFKSKSYLYSFLVLNLGVVKGCNDRLHNDMVRLKKNAVNFG